MIDEHLLNEKEFWTNYPVPSVAVNEPTFSENSSFLWRGHTWIDMNWFIINGLKKHGFENIALELSKNTINLVLKNGFWQYYSPISGNGGGIRNSSRSALIFDIKNQIFNSDSNLDFILNRDWTRIKRLPDF